MNQIDISWKDNWTIRVAINDLYLEDEFKKLFYWKGMVYAADFTKPKVMGKWQMTYKEEEWHLYNKQDTDGSYLFSRGYAPYLLYHLNKWLTHDQVMLLDNHNPFYEELDFPGLYDFQNEDLNKLFKWKQGNMSVYTSYGKTQTIVTFADYLVNKGFRVVVATPGSKPLDELMLRYKKITGKEAHGIKFDDELSFINIVAYTRRNEYKKPEKYEKLAEYLKDVDVLICDEAEYCISGGASDIMHMMTNLKMIYGFSGTTDKAKAEPVSIKDGIKGSVCRNARLAGLLGFTVVYRKPPSKYNIKIYTIASDLFNEPGLDIIDKKFNQTNEEGEKIKLNMSYYEQMYTVYTNEKILRMMEKFMREAGLIFLPMSSLRIIDYYNRLTFLEDGDESVIISSRGIELFTAKDRAKEKTHINLEKLKDMVKNDPNLKVIFGTKSAYSALDLPGLSNIMLVNAKLASAVIQCVGRCARVDNINIYMPRPYKKRFCSFVYNDYFIRKDLIEKYYSKSKIENILIEYKVYHELDEPTLFSSIENHEE